MPRERYDPKRGWIPHEDLLRELETKQKERGVLPPTEEAELERLRRAKAAEDESGKKRPGSSIVR